MNVALTISMHYFDWILNYYSIYFQGDPDKKNLDFLPISREAITSQNSSLNVRKSPRSELN